jgi:hypothetical protein
MQLNFLIDYGDIKPAKVDELVNSLVKGVYGSIEKNADKGLIKVSLASFKDLTPFCRIMKKYATSWA